jgi:hypothetical protein
MFDPGSRRLSERRAITRRADIAVEQQQPEPLAAERREQIAV